MKPVSSVVVGGYNEFKLLKTEIQVQNNSLKKSLQQLYTE